MGTCPEGVEVAGQFQELGYKGYFEYSDDPKVFTEWDKAQGATHRVFCGHGESRPAKVLKTVVHVMIDEPARWVKWNIKQVWDTRQDTTI